MTHWKPQHWIILGCLSLGLIIGFMTGMSVSPTVTTVIGLIFAFTGGSVIVLIKGRDPDELALMGKCLSALALAIALGVIVGVMTRANDWFYFKPSISIIAPYQLQDSLTIDDIIQMHEMHKLDPAIFQILFQVTSKSGGKPNHLTRDDLSKLIDAKVPASVFRMILIGEPMIEKKISRAPWNTSSFLYSLKIPEEESGKFLQLED